MGATFPRIKVWNDLEVLTNEDLNAEFDNILSNLGPLGTDDYSASVLQMQIQTSPGSLGSESLATSLAGELARLRFMLTKMSGKVYWYQTPVLSLEEANTLVSQGNTVPANRIVSGRTDGISNQALFLVPAGASPSVTLKGALTPFVCQINGASVTISSDLALGSLALAPSTNNTALVNDTSMTGQTASKYTGEIDADFPTLSMDTVGTEISALVGKFASFKIVNGGNTGYFLGFVKSASEITKCQRGTFFNSSDSPFTRTVIADNNVITLMRTHWVFLQSAGSLVSITSNPIYAHDQPSSPGLGDYWFDTVNNKWKTYNGASFVDANAHLIGIAITDTANCVGARSGDFFAIYSRLNSMILERVDANTIRGKSRYQSISVAGTLLHFGHDLQEWEMPGDLAPSVSETANTTYYIYVTKDGDTLLDTEQPYDRRSDMLGRYHPYRSWRAVGEIINDGGSNFSTNSLINYDEVDRDSRSLSQFSRTALSGIAPVNDITYCDATAGAFSVFIPSASENIGRELTIIKTDSTFNAITIDGYGAELVDGAATTTLNTINEALTIVSDGLGWVKRYRYIDQRLVAYTPTYAGLGTPTSVTFNYARQGSMIRIFGEALAGTTTGANLTISLPTGLTVGTLGSPNIVGQFWARSATNGPRSIIVVNGASVMNAGTTPTYDSPANGNQVVASTEQFCVQAFFPIAGWNN